MLNGEGTLFLNLEQQAQDDVPPAGFGTRERRDRAENRSPIHLHAAPEINVSDFGQAATVLIDQAWRSWVTSLSFSEEGCWDFQFRRGCRPIEAWT